jgi:hypothetical protein
LLSVVLSLNEENGAEVLGGLDATIIRGRFSLDGVFFVPELSAVTGSPSCSRCAWVFPQSRFRFQWGRVPGGEYEIGDAVEWLVHDGSPITPFSYRSNHDGVWQWNCGDPGSRNVLVLDELGLGSMSDLCPNCKAGHSALAIRVDDGVFASIMFLTAEDQIRVFGDPPVEADIAIVNDDGTYSPRPDWFDPTLDTTFVVRHVT